MNNPNDTVQVRLTAAGQKAADGAPLKVNGGKVPLKFTGSVAQDVHVTVWRETLRSVAPYGEPWFEIVPAAPAPLAGTPAAPAPAASVAPKPTSAAPAADTTSAK
jgi:hypothetical protein